MKFSGWWITIKKMKNKDIFKLDQECEGTYMIRYIHTVNFKRYVNHVRDVADMNYCK